MPGLRAVIVRNFAFYPNVRKCALEQAADALRQLAHFPDAPLGHQVLKEGGLAHSLIESPSSAEKIHDPKYERQREAQHNTCDDGKVKGRMPPLIRNIAGQPLQAKW